MLSGPGGRSNVAAIAAKIANESKFVVRPDRDLRRLLMAAAGRAVTDERDEFGLADLLTAAEDAPTRSDASDDPGEQVS
jgi:hypothetical protein